MRVGSDSGRKFRGVVVFRIRIELVCSHIHYSLGCCCSHCPAAFVILLRYIVYTISLALPVAEVGTGNRSSVEQRAGMYQSQAGYQTECSPFGGPSEVQSRNILRQRQQTGCFFKLFTSIVHCFVIGGSGAVVVFDRLIRIDYLISQ